MRRDFVLLGLRLVGTSLLHDLVYGLGREGQARWMVRVLERMACDLVEKLLRKAMHELKASEQFRIQFCMHTKASKYPMD